MYVVVVVKLVECNNGGHTGGLWSAEEKRPERWSAEGKVSGALERWRPYRERWSAGALREKGPERWSGVWSAGALREKRPERCTSVTFP